MNHTINEAMIAVEKRKEIDFANVVLCLLVMLIHILSKAVSALDRTSVQFAAVFIPSRLASFVVQGFIFLSAMKYFMRYWDGGLEYGKFLWARIKTIVVPYVIWNVIYYFSLMPFGYFIFDPLALLKYILVGDMISHFYFVVIIVQFYVLMPLWVWLVKRISGKILIPLSLIIMVVFSRCFAPQILYEDRIFIKYIFYWICGCFAGKYYKEFLGLLRNNWRWISAFFILTAGADVFLTLAHRSGTMAIPYLDDIHIVYCMAAILFVFTASLWKIGQIVDDRFFSMINRQSYNIYLSHCLLLYFADGFASRYMAVGQGELLLFRLVICYGITFVLWGAYDCIKRQNLYKSGC